MKAAGAVLVLVALVLAAGGCVLRTTTEATAAPDVDRTLTTFSFIEEGELITFVVDTKATRERGTEPYIPVEIAVGNRGLPRLTLTRESFTLADEAGNRYPCVGPRDLLQGYNFLDFDRKLAELPGIVSTKFTNFTRYASMFSPQLGAQPTATGTSVVLDSVTLPKFGYLIDVIYFPRPTTELLGKRLELFLEAPELNEPVFVKFIVR